MPEVDPVTLRLIVEDKQAVASLNRYGRVADQQFSLVQKGAMGAQRALGLLGGALAGVSAAAIARAFLDIADTAKTLDAQLRLATTGFGTFAKAQEDVRRIAAETRSGLEETASLYGNFARGAKELGANQESAARATETFAKTLKISGAGANEAASATLQFGQALAAGALRGDELNSILEASPRLARLLTESMGVPIGKIKELGEAGKLTADKLLNALTNRKFTESIDAEFRQMPVTFEQAMTQVSNAAIITFGAFDKGGQFSTALANFITNGTGGFADLEQSALDFGISARANIEGLAAAFGPVFSEAERLFAYLSGGFQGIDIGRDIQASLDQIDMATSKIGGGTNLGGRNRADKERFERTRRGEIAEQTFNDRVGQFFNRDGSAVRPTTPARPAATSSGPKKKTGGGANSAEAAARKAEQERLRDIRDEAGKVRGSAQLQDDINAAKAAMAVATRDILQFNLEAINSEERQRTAEYQTQRKLGELTDQELADRTAAVAEIADLQRQRVFQIAEENERREKLDQAQASNQNQQDLYRAELDLLDLRDDRHAVELRLVDLAYQQERAELEGVIASQTATQAQKDIAAARLAILGQLQNSDEQAIGRRYESPLEQRRREVRQTTANMGHAIEDLELEALDRLTDGLADASTEFLKLGGVAGDVLNSIIGGLVKLAAQQEIFGKTGSGGLIGSIGGLLGIGGGAKLGGVNYGAIGQAANSVRLPGFDTGGYTGDGPRKQVAGVVHKGEYVVPAEAVKRIGVDNLAALSSARAASAMAGVTAAAGGQAGGVAMVRVELTDDLNGRIAQVSGPIAVSVVKQNAPAIAGAGATAGSTMARERMTRTARNRIPG